MSHGYTTVQWNRNKRFYDLAIVVGVVAFVVVYMAVAMTRWTGPQALSPEIVMIRALAACAFAMLTIILCIGPLARLSPRFLPLLYNRRHLGVSFFIVALAHGGLATVLARSIRSSRSTRPTAASTPCPAFRSSRSARWR